MRMAKDASTSKNKLIEIFSRIEHFFQRLEIYTGFTPTADMTYIMVSIMVEILTIFAIATKEVKSGWLSKLMSHLFTLLDSHFIQKSVSRS